MKRMLSVMCVWLCVFGVALADDEAEAIKKIQEFSVTIKSGISEGSGTIITRELKNEDGDLIVVNFILTAGHVVDDLRRVRTVIEDGKDKKIVEFKDAFYVQEELDSGRRVGEVKRDCKVISYSDANNNDDIALLMIIKKGCYPTSVNAQFSFDEITPIGTRLWHCGSLLGQMGANSLTNGIMSQIGRTYQGKVYDQTTVTAFPGSSGGGVFIIKDKSPKYVGMLTRGTGETFNLIVPIRRIRKWADSRGLEWVYNPMVPMPTLKEVLELDPENSAADESVKNTADDKKQFIFMDGENAKHCQWYTGKIPSNLPQR